MPDKDEAFWLDLEHRLEQIENNAEGDHKAIKVLSGELQKLRNELEQLKSDFEKFRKEFPNDVWLLMWFAEQARVVGHYAAEGNQREANKADKAAREQLETVQKVLRRYLDNS